uniref:Uncharacterized protein n=1 Tax=Anguilla anguilla TaxID=7936 RepID=A0A0E9U2G8_ANGAN
MLSWPSRSSPAGAAHFFGGCLLCDREIC